MVSEIARKLRTQTQATSRSAVGSAWLLLVMSVATVLIHGYHLGTEDAAIYVPGIKRAADPGLYPFNSEFFMGHAKWSLFPKLVSDTALLAKMPIDAAILFWYFASTFAVLAASLVFLRVCFRRECACWTGVAVLAALLNVPVAGTALLLADSYLTARSLSTATTIFAIAAIIANRPRRAMLWIATSLAIHVQMGIYGVLFGVCHLVASRIDRVRNSAAYPSPSVAVAVLLPLFAVNFHPARGVYREILASREYFLVSTWHWWEWVGVFAPLGILAILARYPLREVCPPFRSACRAAVLLGVIATLAGSVIASSGEFEMIARIQPMRSFHPIYAVLFLLLGGLLGEYVLQGRLWWSVAFLFALAGAMLAVELATYPLSPHLELPGTNYRSGWLSSFLWIRSHTPKNAFFAIDPDYMLLRGVDLHGFRALAERSVLADNVKDSGAVSVFPDLGGDWKRQTTALKGWERFKRQDFETLRSAWGVEWVVVARSHSIDGLRCAFQNDDVRVCRIASSQAVR